MPSSVSALRRSPSRTSGRALLVAAALSAGAVTGLAGLGAAVAAPAPVEQAPLVLRTDGVAVTSGDARADPSFTSALLAAGCPADADDAARLSMTAGGATVVTSPTIAAAPGQPVEVPMTISFEEVVAGGVEEGGATLALECLVVESGIPSSVVAAATLPVTFAAGTWSVPRAEVDPVPPSDAPTAVPTGPGTVPAFPPTPTEGAGAGAGSAPRPSPTARPAADESLAFTGGQVAGIGALAAGLLAGGTALVLLRRRGGAGDQSPPA
jgi:hypothetical protein